MSVKYALTDGSARVENSSVSVQSFRFCDFAGSRKQGGRDNWGGLRQLYCIFYMDCGNDKDMRWRLRNDVSESQNILVAINNIGRNLALYYFTEEAVGI